MNRDLKILSASMLAWALGEGLFIYQVPLYLAELGAEPAQIGRLLALFALTQAAVMIPAGLFSDRWGARGVMVAAWPMGLIAAFIMAAAPSLPLYSLGYFLYALSGWVMPPTTAYVTSARGALSPQRALTLVMAGYSAGLIVSPALGGVIAEAWGLRSLFVLASAFFTISTVMAFFTRSQPPPPPLAGPRYATLLRNRSFAGFMLLVLLITTILWLGVPLAPNFLQAQWGVQLSGVGLLGSAASLGALVMALVLGGRPPRRALLLLQLFSGLYLFLLLRTGLLPWLALAFFLQAGAPNISRQFVDAIATRIVAPGQLGLAFAASALVGRLANMAAAAAAGQLYEIRPALPFQVSLLLIPLGLLLVHFLFPRAHDAA